MGGWEVSQASQNTPVCMCKDLWINAHILTNVRAVIAMIVSWHE